VGSGRTRWAASWWADAAEPVGQEMRSKVAGTQDILQASRRCKRYPSRSFG
jgi:hypothetical protein